MARTCVSRQHDPFTTLPLPGGVLCSGWRVRESLCSRGWLCLPVAPQVELNIWDTAGQEEFAKLTRNYYAGECCWGLGANAVLCLATVEGGVPTHAIHPGRLRSRSAVAACACAGLWQCAGASACVLAFSSTDRDSFEAVKKWKQQAADGVCCTLI